MKSFEHFLNGGIVKSRKPDIPRSRSLTLESGNRLKFVREMVEKIGITDENANYFIEHIYDTLISLIRARMLEKGFHASGEGAHEAEVSYLGKLAFREHDIRFMDNLRYNRNGMLYYGKKHDMEYAQATLEFMDRMVVLLKRR